MTEEFVIDADDGYIPVQAEPVKVRIGGTLYEATCPPDKKWHLFIPLQESDSENGPEAMVEFLKASLSEDDAAEVLQRMRDPQDDEVSLMKLMYVFGRVLSHYQPMIQEHFATMGMDAPGAEPEPVNRAQRRTAAKPAGRGGGSTKAKRTPRSQTGARSGR
ncbi:hypothetical protein ACFV42_23245 [Streptomyces solisilvae]|uniref:hypothetical protein n=1 Tax=Streptomyces malaysiensis TaxID=92644 RepID=UPI0036951BE0